ncbi:hypothetical protein GCM10009785_35120 [Brooklawnia cerclae]|uniref:Uncharacterized protein n=1 Tax=Brooklawnia cerclae TaxID=349934 RepID=A0ABX0SFB3_9ACTN|nr:hypothetical protein [Brooklawnia cerclae]NIH55357.1 hypothetical protein [Brooklawnia cerclae]
MTSKTPAAVAGTDQLVERLTRYLDALDVLITEGRTADAGPVLDPEYAAAAQVYAQAAQATAAALAVLPSGATGELWTAPTPTPPAFLNMGAEDGTR